MTIKLLITELNTTISQQIGLMRELVRQTANAERAGVVPEGSADTLRKQLDELERRKAEVNVRDKATPDTRQAEKISEETLARRQNVVVIGEQISQLSELIALQKEEQRLTEAALQKVADRNASSRRAQIEVFEGAVAQNNRIFDDATRRIEQQQRLVRAFLSGVTKDINKIEGIKLPPEVESLRKFVEQDPQKLAEQAVFDRRGPQVTGDGFTNVNEAVEKVTDNLNKQKRSIVEVNTLTKKRESFEKEVERRTKSITRDSAKSC